MSLIEVMASIRKNISPDFVYDQEEADRLYEERKREFESQRDRDCESYLRGQNDLRYSMIPEKYQKADFTDLRITKENQGMIERVVHHVKNFEQMRKGICLMGSYGVGKTSLIAIACKKLIEEKDKRVYFATEQTIIEEVKKTFNSTSTDEIEDVVRRICKNDIVVIDELGTTKNEWELSIIKRIIDGVINGNKRLFVTTNYIQSELLERWGQSDTYKIPKQVVDRMNEAMDLYEIKSEKSFRR